MLKAIRPVSIGKASLKIVTATATVAGSSESQTDTYGTPVSIAGMPNISSQGIYCQDVVSSCVASDDYHGESVSNRSTTALYGVYFLNALGEKIIFTSGYNYWQIGSVTSYARIVNYGWNQGYTGIEMAAEGNNYFAGGLALSLNYAQASNIPVSVGLWLRTTNCSVDLTLKLAFIWTTS